MTALLIFVGLWFGSALLVVAYLLHLAKLQVEQAGSAPVKVSEGVPREAAKNSLREAPAACVDEGCYAPDDENAQTRVSVQVAVLTDA